MSNRPKTEPTDVLRFLIHVFSLKQGFEHLDPFIPILVDQYDQAELNSALDYYTERRWIQHPSAKSEAGRAELRTLSGGSGFELMRLCAPL